MTEWRDLVKNLVSHARDARQRRVLVMAGARSVAITKAQAALAAMGATEVLWISDAPPDEVRGLRGSQARQLLGMEMDAIVFDMYAGVDAEAFGAVAGAIRAGGLLLIIAPPHDGWADFDDSEQARVAVHPFVPAELSRRFLQRFLRQLTGAEGVVWMEEGATPQLLPGEALPPVPRQQADARGCLTADQRAAFDAILAVVSTEAPIPLVLTSDRGRGKSAVLGLAAAELLRTGLTRIVVTAPRFDAAAIVFAHAQKGLPAAQRSHDVMQYRDSRLQFVAPDALVEQAPPELLLVDEAAAIPVALLERMVQRTQRVVFATTVHGYEGSGRGFATRFHAILDSRAAGWRAMHLQQPVRWAAGDPLERLVFRALLLDGAPATAETARHATPEACAFTAIDRDELVQSDRLLGQLFGLLVSAHYRTTPLDLRHLLDGPNLSVWLVRYEDQVIGGALVALEGGFEPVLARAVWEGRRRPRGHLLPQSLAVHAGIEEAATLRVHRIVRIAVHPAAQGRGIGRRLVHMIRRHAESTGADALGSSFGLSEGLVHFWRGAGCHPVRIGLTREAASGAPALMVMRPISQPGVALYHEARARFLDLLPHLLRDPLRDLQPSLGTMLGWAGDHPPKLERLNDRDWKELAAYVAGIRDVELVLGPLRRLLDEPTLEQLEPPARALVEAKLRACMSWSDMVDLFHLRGRGDAANRLRAALSPLLRSRGGTSVDAEVARLAIRDPSVSAAQR